MSQLITSKRAVCLIITALSLTLACSEEEPFEPSLTPPPAGGGVEGGAEGSGGVSALPPRQGTPVSKGGDEAGGEGGSGGGGSSLFVPVDLTEWGLSPSPQAPMGGSEGAPPLEPCPLPELAMPVDHPLARGEEAPRPVGAERVERVEQVEQVERVERVVAPIAHPQLTSAPPYVSKNNKQDHNKQDLVMPSLNDDMPLFERAEDWSAPRCYEVQPGEGALLTQEQAYERYARLVLSTLWRRLDERPERRTVIGVRGAYPGMSTWHHNTPNYYNDTLALLWRDAEGQPHVLEFPVTTEMGVYDFGADNSSALRPNRHYPYVNGWHKDYNALRINLPSYPVRDDTNNNGHWDSDRNGWLEGPEEGLDYDRLGTAHNIHGAAAPAPLERAEVNITSAGCQVVPGALNWERFITQAWTGLGDEVDYYLIDARDIPHSFFEPCAQEDGSHACPYSVTSFPYSASDNTALSEERLFDRYSCDDANEGGAERVYVLNLPAQGVFKASVSAPEGVDPDLHLLEGDEARACYARGHEVIERELPAGRYVLIVDTWVNSAGEELAGPYELLVEWRPL